MLTCARGHAICTNKKPPTDITACSVQCVYVYMFLEGTSNNFTLLKHDVRIGVTCTHTYTVSPVEKLTNRTEPEANWKRTTSVPRPHQDRTSTVPRPHHERTPRPHHNRTTSILYLDRTRTVPRAYLDGTTSRTSTASAYSTSTAPPAYALTIPYKSLQYLVMNA